MKKYALVAFVLLISIVSVGAVLGKEISTVSNFSSAKLAKITQEEAKKIALKKVAGTVEDEYTIEDDDGNVTTYVFVIKDKKEKTFEVQVDAKDGKILSAEEVTEETEDSEDPEDPFTINKSE